MKLCIAEKPSVAKEIAEIIGAKTRRDGYFEGNGYLVTWTFGHLCTLKEPHDYTLRWKAWNYSSLPMIPERFGIKLIENGGIEKQFKTIETLVAKATEVINCGDAGQEGEVIQRWVLQKAGMKVPLKRLWISSLTEEAIRDGFNNLMDGNDFDPLYHAGMARAIGDWLLGMNATRLYTLKYGGGTGVLSIGRVQTPTLALVVERCKEIDNFVPKPFWELKTLYRDTTFSVKSGRFSSVESATEQLEIIKTAPFTITSIDTKKQSEHPPRLFDLTSLQVECNKKLNLTAEETLKTIQSLYEKKLTTYPRVDTTFLPDDIYPKIPKVLSGLKPYERLISPLLAGKIRKSKKVFDNKKITDHHAIIPTGQFNAHMSDNEKKVFNIVILRFISVFYPDCKISNTTVEGDVKKIGFKATGKQILEPGWRVVYGNQSSKEDNILPLFTVGEEGPHEPTLAEKQTTPPKHHTEATLLRAMESAGKNVDDEELRELMKDNGIGRPSTRANIIETLFRRRYLRRERKRVVATQTGMELIGTIGNDLLKSAELTGQWERKLRMIEAGEFEVSQFMIEMKELVSSLVIEVMKSSHKSIVSNPSDSDKSDKKERSSRGEKVAKERAPRKSTKIEGPITCPHCKKGTIVKGNKAWGCSNYGAECKLLIPFELYGKRITEQQMQQLATKGKTRKLKGFKIDGQEGNSFAIILSSESSWRVTLEK